MNKRPRLQLTGVNGNVFAIIAAARDAARRAGWPSEKRAELVHDLMHAGSYDNVLSMLCERFEVE